MRSFILFYACLPLLVIAMAVFYYLMGQFLNWLLSPLRNHLRKIQSKDYLPPPPSDFWHWFKINLVSALCWVFVGKMEIEGREVLDGLPAGSAFTLAPNHSHVADIFIVPLLLRRWKARFMSAPAVMSWFGGFFGIVFSTLGAFTASRKAGVEVLKSGQALMLFPEGYVNLDGAMSRCKSGIVSISREAEEALGRPVFIIPMYMRFGKYPGAWIRRKNMLWRLLYMTSCFWYYRRGVKIVIGKPILMRDLSDDLAIATLQVAQAIRFLDPSLRIS